MGLAPAVSRNAWPRFHLKRLTETRMFPAGRSIVRQTPSAPLRRARWLYLMFDYKPQRRSARRAIRRTIRPDSPERFPVPVQRPSKSPLEVVGNFKAN
jgi:hypothetical protein